ncbi:MAG: metal ABC transporter solute-binding protein, Zn/Mn family [Pirellulaceae bacterium]
MKHTISSAVLATLLMAGVFGCSPDSQPRNTDKSASGENGQASSIRIVATVGMVADIVQNVGGEHVRVETLMGAGVDPHLYRATRDDVAKILAADMVFYCGLMLEGKMADTLAKVGQSKPAVSVAEEIPKSELLEPDDSAGHADPHVWMDVQAWSKCVDIVAQALSSHDSDHAADFESNAARYVEKLGKLHDYGKERIGSIPQGSRVLITSHDAFNYFGRAYNLEVQGVQGLSTESEAGLQRINGLVDLIVDRQIKAVFVESSVSRKNIDALIEGAGSRGHELIVGGELYSDAMGETGSYEGTYIGMLDHNLTLVARGLGGSAPEAGFQGKLKPAEH